MFKCISRGYILQYIGNNFVFIHCLFRVPFIWHRIVCMVQGLHLGFFVDATFLSHQSWCQGYSFGFYVFFPMADEPAASFILVHLRGWALRQASTEIVGIFLVMLVVSVYHAFCFSVLVLGITWFPLMEKVVQVAFALFGCYGFMRFGLNCLAVASVFFYLCQCVLFLEVSTDCNLQLLVFQELFSYFLTGFYSIKGFLWIPCV